MHVPSGCHIFQIYNTNRTSCVHLVWGTRLNARSWWSDDVQSRIYFYVILYIYLCQHQEVFNNFHVRSVFTLITMNFYVQN
jgi:hypothetical protein